MTRYYAEGKGYASMAQACIALAKKELYQEAGKWVDKRIASMPRDPDPMGDTPDPNELFKEFFRGKFPVVERQRNCSNRMEMRLHWLPL